MTRIRSPLSALLASLLVLAGCATLPPPETGAIPLPAAFKEAVPVAANPGDPIWQPARPADGLPRGAWWTVFGDPVLDALQERARQANQDVKAAAARVAQARALLQTAQANQQPQVDTGGGVSRQRLSAASAGLPADANPATNTLWRAQIGAAYEVDLFGRLAADEQAALADAAQREALYHTVLLALQADVAQAYFGLRQLDTEQRLFENTVALRTQTLTLVERRHAEGDIGELDVARSRTELASARSEQLALARQRATAEHALATLLGSAPADFSLPTAPLAPLSVAVPAGLPSALLERRPDIAAAARAMAAANARTGAAHAAFFPRLTLGASAGFESARLGDLMNWSGRTFLLGPLAGTLLSLPLFDGGRREAGLAQAHAVQQETAAIYRQTVLTALREVEDGLSDLRLLAEQTRAQADAIASSARAAHLSRIQYREGSVSYLDVMDADRSVLAQQRVGVHLDQARAHATVALIRALGGGWQSDDAL